MSRAVLSTPVGQLAIAGDGAAITRISWSVPPASTDRPVSDPVCEHAIAELEAYFDRRLTRFTVPFILIGTDFQRRVWEQMLDVPFGQVTTYGAIAGRLGAGARAVGTACGQNPIPIIVPCHRIVGSDGLLVGYSGGRGLETKRKLLDIEQGQGRLF